MSREQGHEVGGPQSASNVWLVRVARVLFLGLCIETLFSIPYRSVHLATHSAKKSWIAALVAGAFIYLVVRLLRDHLPKLSWPRAFQEGSSRWIVGWLVVGIVVRLIWTFAFPVTLQSDGLAYFIGAKSLATEHAYPGAFWPPGFPLFLSPFFAIFGSTQWVVVLCGLVLFSATYLVSTRLADKLGGPIAARLVGPLLALWPGYVTIVGINSKEALIALLVSTAMLLLASAKEGSWIPFLGVGALVGWATLAQPGFMLFPSVILVYELLRTRSIVRTIVRLVLVGVALLVVVLPWTYRNYLVFHRLVVVSNNGGSVFYRANNPKANASYSIEGEIPLPKDEFEADKIGYAEGKKWIKEHPLDFAALSVRKQVVYLGDDGIGVYETLKRGQAPSGLLYAGSKLLCSLFWLAAWVLLFACAPTLFSRGPWVDWFGLCFLPMLYQWAIDSVFESGSRHHGSYVGLLAVLIAVAVKRYVGQSATADQRAAEGS